MKQKSVWLAAFVAVCCGVLLSCTKERQKNSECDIVSAWVEGTEYEQYFYRSADMRVEEVLSSSTEITFTVRSMTELPTAIPVFFAVTEGATVSPASGSMQDFTRGPVTYTVTSEDGVNRRVYQVGFKQQGSSSGMSYTYSFEGVDSVSVNSHCAYHVFYEPGTEGERDYIWASGNEGVAMIHSSWNPGQFPTRSLSDGYVGKGVCLVTQDAGSLGRMMHKPIAAGNLFIGRFDVTQVLTNPLKCTVFGMPVNRQPAAVSGYYKYQPGEVFTNANMETVEGRVDECNIYAVFFRNQNDAGEAVTLYGDDVFTSPYVVSVARVGTLPATGEWRRFEMVFEGPSADAALLEAYGYSLTLVMTSSKSGDTFEGAIGSTLMVDEVEVTYKQ